MKRKLRRNRNKKNWSKAYKKQIVSQILRMSRKDIADEATHFAPLNSNQKLLIDGSPNDAIIDKGLWLNHHSYQEGYIGVAIRLLDFIKLSDSNTIKDSYIYVSLFCFRQYLELSMKDSLIHYYSEECLETMVKEIGHNLVRLYEEIKKLHGFTQDDETTAVETIINTIQGIDPKGEAFRYPYSINEETGEIKTNYNIKLGLKNVRVLRTRMLQLYNFFDGINNMVHDYKRKGITCSQQEISK